VKKNSIYLWMMVFIFLTGCVEQPKIPKYHISKNDKIGYIIQPSGNVHHSHMGTTVFNNIEKTYKYNWHLEKNVKKGLEQNINKKLINLSKYNIKFSDVKDMMIFKNGQWIIQNKIQYNQLLNKLHLRAVILVGENTTYIETGRSPIVMNTSGLASSNFIGLKRYFAVSAYDFNLYLLQPKAIIEVKDITKSEMIYDSVFADIQKATAFKEAEDIENITKEEFSIVHKSIIQLIYGATEEVEYYLE